MKAWHFVGETLRNGDPIPRDGEKLIFTGDPILCDKGLHAALQPFDALRYAPGNVLCLVEVGGIIIHGNDKLVVTERTIICRMDAEEALWFFARMQALSVAHLWDIPDVVLEYLMTGNEDIRASASASASAWESASASAWARKGFNEMVYGCFSEWMDDWPTVNHINQQEDNEMSEELQQIPQVIEPAPSKPVCRRCGRPLRNPLSVVNGMGPVCWRKHRATPVDA